MKIAKVGILSLFLALLSLMSINVVHAEERVVPEAQAPAVLDINQATAEQIAKALKGVGLSKAKAIVEYRQIHGPFVRAEELTKVKGIGPSIVMKNKERIGISLQ